MRVLTGCAVLLLLAAAVCLTDAKEEHQEEYTPSLGETRPGATQRNISALPSDLPRV